MALINLGFSKKKEKSSGSGTLDKTTNVFGTTGFNKAGVQSEQLNIDQAGIDKLIADVLGGADGLASIFSAENASGIFDSTNAAQAAGDLATKLVGELAQLTAEKVTSSAESGKQVQTEEEILKALETNKSKGKSSGFTFGLSAGGT